MRRATFRPVRQTRISEVVAEQIKASLLRGHFKTGDKLPSERELAEEFQVSRVAIREALRRLENSGFVLTRQGVSGGVYVTDLTFEHLADAFLDLYLADKISIPELYQIRLLIEPEIARMAAQNITAEYAHRLKEILKTEELPVTSLLEDQAMKTALHYTLAEMCGNRVFQALTRSLMELTKRLIEAVDPDPHTMHPAGMHRPIVEAILAHDPEAAAAAMRRHAVEFGENLINMDRIYHQRKARSAV